MRRIPCGWLLLLLLPVLPAAAEEESAPETIWLRGRGSDVWIERRPAADAPEGQRKGLTRVATPKPKATRPGARHASADGHRHAIGVALGAAHGAHDGCFEHDYAPRFYYPPYSFRLFPYSRSLHARRHLVGHPGYGRWAFVRPHKTFHGFHHGFGPRHSDRRHRFGHSFGHSSRHDRGALRAYRNAGPYGGGVRSGGHVLRGGAYRRVR